MKVIMLGEKFPTHISGSSRTACHHLSKELASFNDITPTFAVPKAFGDENRHAMKLVSANHVNNASI